MLVCGFSVSRLNVQRATRAKQRVVARAERSVTARLEVDMYLVVMQNFLHALRAQQELFFARGLAWRLSD